MPDAGDFSHRAGARKLRTRPGPARGGSPCTIYGAPRAARPQLKLKLKAKVRIENKVSIGAAARGPALAATADLRVRIRAEPRAEQRLRGSAAHWTALCRRRLGLGPCSRRAWAWERAASGALSGGGRRTGMSRLAIFLPPRGRFCSQTIGGGGCFRLARQAWARYGHGQKTYETSVPGDGAAANAALGATSAGARAPEQLCGGDTCTRKTDA